MKRTRPQHTHGTRAAAALRAHAAAYALALFALCALCLLGSCIGPGLEPPGSDGNAPRPRSPGGQSVDAGVTTGGGNFGNGANGGTGTTDEPETGPMVPGPTDMGGEPSGDNDADLDAGTDDPADSP